MKDELNGLKIFETAVSELKIDVANLIAKTAIWVNPEVVKILQKVKGNEFACWYMNSRRYNIGLKEKRRTYQNGEYLDDNLIPNQIMKNLTGCKITPDTFVVCHIFDEGRNTYHKNYYSSIPNMVLIPKPISELDRHKHIKDLLKYKSYDLYKIKLVKNIIKPEGYDKLCWREPLEFKESVKKKVEKHIDKSKCIKLKTNQKQKS